MRALIVEDDPILLDGLQVGLVQSGFVADGVMTWADAEAALSTSTFDVVVLDVMLPDGSGLKLLSRMRANGLATPMLLLTARDSTSDRISGLDAGADDYMGKPFDLAELAARLRALVRRAAGRAEPGLKWRDIVMDPSRMMVKRAEKLIRLSRREYSVLHALMDRPGQIFSKGQLEEKLYGWQEDVESNAIEVHVHHLRTKLGAELIETVRGIGYRLGEAA